jgi:hypothetical protein
MLCFSFWSKKSFVAIGRSQPLYGNRKGLDLKVEVYMINGIVVNSR